MINFLNLLIVLHLLIFAFPVCFSSSNLDLYNRCAQNFTCGNVNVSFPFWGGSRPKECGYSELELTCEDVIKPAIEMKGMKFYVKGINQKTSVLTIAREDLSDGICLHTFVNTTLDYTRFYNAQGTQNITILYGCPGPEDGYGYAGVVGGGSSGGGYRATFYCRISGVPDTDTNSYIQPGVTGPNGCNQSVVVPVSASSNTQLQQRNDTVILTKAVQDGFEVNYKVQDQDISLCAECAASEGRCVIDHIVNKATCVCSDGSSAYSPCSVKQSRKGRRKLNIVLPAAFFSVIATCMLLILLFYHRKRFITTNNRVEVFRGERKVDVESFLKGQGSLAPKRYTYSDLKNVANSFKDKLGEGGYGSVYKGQLQDGNLVAVKMPHKTGHIEEFINEFASSGSTNHVNVVKLLGFCYEGNRRALVYEFMPNGSLEKFLDIRNNPQSLNVETLFKIAIGVARGLEYLHRGCNTRILHFDIKPHNILLDENFFPKISDFGLAKSCPQRDSTLLSMSEARGTVGYIAPEVFFKSYGGVSYKSDVYSYGMMVLEMVGCRRKAYTKGENSSEQYFPDWIYNQLEAREEPNQESILNSEQIELQRKMIIVSLWCVKDNPSSRPEMSKVVEMLEGTLELQAPPPSSISGSLSTSLKSQHSIHTTE